MLYLGEREKACKKLWKEVFQDEDRWIDDFLVNYYRSEQLLSIEEAGEMVSMLHLIPFQMDGLQVGYIYALATSERMRGRGYATRLLQKSIERGRQENWDALVLIPEREELFGYYARWGFQGHYPVEFVVDGGYDFGLEEKERERCMVLPLSEKWQELEKDKRFTLRYLS